MSLAENNRSNIAFLDAQTVAEVVGEALTSRVGKREGKMHPDIICRDTDTVYDTFKHWKAGDRSPELYKFLRLCQKLGPDFTSEVLSLIGQGGVEWIDNVPVDAPGSLAHMLDVCSDFAERLKDGKFCHVDKAESAPKLRALAAILEQQANAMEGKSPVLKSVPHEGDIA